MKWNSEDLIDFLGNYDSSLRPEFGRISIISIDPTSKIGFGVDHDGAVVLMLPAQPESLGFETKFATFDPITAVFWEEQNATFTDVSILKCRIDINDLVVVRSFAAIMSGIIDIQRRFGEVGNVLWTLKSLFETGFTPQFSRDELVGLLGELIVIDSAANPSRLIKYWHTDPKAKFDFSSSSVRLEVKTTTSQNRNHYVSSSQVFGNSSNHLFFVSLKLDLVEVGTSFQDVYNALLSKLSLEGQIHLTKVIVQTLSVPPFSVEGLHFDEKSALGNIRVFVGDLVPFPILPPEVLSANCLISFDGLNSFSSTIDEVDFD